MIHAKRSKTLRHLLDVQFQLKGRPVNLLISNDQTPDEKEQRDHKRTSYESDVKYYRDIHSRPSTRIALPHISTRQLCIAHDERVARGIAWLLLVPERIVGRKVGEGRCRATMDRRSVRLRVDRQRCGAGRSRKRCCLHAWRIHWQTAMLVVMHGHRGARVKCG